MQKSIGVLALACAAVRAEFSVIYEWDTNNLGGFSVAENFPDADGAGGSSTALLLTSYSFGDFETDNVQVARDFPGSVNSGTPVDATRVTEQSIWPRTADMMPEGAIRGVRNAMLTLGGFLLPFKNPGAVDLYELDASGNVARRNRLTPEEGAFFYTRHELHDMNGDGRLDILTHRAESGFPPIPGTPTRGEVMWLEQPLNPMTDPWTKHTIAAGPEIAGVNFRTYDFDGDGLFEIVSAGYFTSKLHMYACDEPLWSRCGTNATQEIILEKDIGKVFDLVVDDANNDGQMDLIVTNNADDGSGAAYVYQVPENFKQDGAVFTRHTIIDGINIPFPAPGLGAPGSLITYRPRTQQDQKPIILVCGDDSGELFQLTAQSQDNSVWGYDSEVILEVFGVLNSVLVTDITGDGDEELLVGLYSAKKGLVLKWQDGVDEKEEAQEAAVADA